MKVSWLGFGKKSKDLSYEQRRRRFAWLVIGVVIMVGLVVSGISEQVRPRDEATGVQAIFPEISGKFTEKLIEGEGRDKIVLLRAEGILVGERTDGFTSGFVNIEELTRQMDQAKKDEAVKAVILVINSPGGSITASDTIYQKINDLKKANKKVVALMRETAASGGYYIASPADKIIASTGTLTGSIGVILQTINIEGLFEKVGLRAVTFKAGKFKDILNPTRAVTEEEATLIQDLMAEAYETFLGAVAEGRKIERGKLLELADGKIYSGEQAKQVGLVDELGNLPKAIEVAKKLAEIEEARVVEYTSFLGGLQSFLPFFSGSSAKAILSQVSPELTLRPGLYYLWLSQ